MRPPAPLASARRLILALGHTARGVGTSRHSGSALPAALVAVILIGSLITTQGSGATGTTDAPTVSSPSGAGEHVAVSSPVRVVDEPRTSDSLEAPESRPPVTRPPPVPTTSPTGAPAPEVVRFRPRDGWTGVSISADLSVRFTRSMDHAATESAFHALAGGVDIGGSVRWAAGDTVLVLDTTNALPYGATVVLQVDGGAASADGVAVSAPAQATFTVQPKPIVAAWGWPLLGPLTQLFGQSLTQYGVHNGIDVDGETGDPVRAARAGVVTVAGEWDACGGLQVQIDHGDGIVSWYRHLSRIDVGVGESVGVGTVVGAVGATGCALGSHLHFGVNVDGTFVDPLSYLPPR